MKHRVKGWFFQLRTKRWVVWVCVIVWWVIVGTMQWFRYQHDAYSAFDLSIYTQVLWNMSHGHGVLSSVQGHNYFADHVEPLLFAIVPLFRVWSSPLLLLWLQTFCIGLAVFPLRRIAACTLGKEWQNIPAVLFLLNAVTWNIALFEFHVYAFALPLCIWVACAYMEQNFSRFLIGLGIAAVLREDVTLVVFFFGVFSLLRRRSMGWWLWPMLIGVAGALIAFLVQWRIPGVSLQWMYFPWLNELVSGHIAQGFALLGQILLRISPYRMVLVGVLAFGVVVVCGWEWWVPIIPTLALFASTNRSVETILVASHHAAVTTAFFWVAGIVGAKRVIQFSQKKQFFGVPSTPPVVVSICALLFMSWVFVWQQRPWIAPQLILQDTAGLEQRIGATDGVLASANVLPNVASRQIAQLSWYVFKGHDELNQSEYSIDPAVEWVLFDSNEFADFRTKAEYLPEQAEAFTALLQEHFSLVDSVGPALLFRRGEAQAEPFLDSLVSVTQHPQDVPRVCDAAHLFSLYSAPTLSGSVLTVRVQVHNPDCWQQLEAKDHVESLLNIFGTSEQTSVLLGYGFVKPAGTKAGDIITTTIQVPDRVLAGAPSLTITGTVIHPIAIQLARNQSSARADSIRNTFFTAQVAAE